MKKSTILMLMGVGIMAACNDPQGGVEKDSLSDATADTAVMYSDERGRIAADGVEIIDVGEDFWAGIDWDAPVVEDPEMSAANVELRATEEYNIYTMDDRILFDTDKAQIRSEGKEKLQEIVDEIKDLPRSGQIRIFGHADARHTHEYNRKLSAERANSVKDWLEKEGGIDTRRMSIEPMGETAPRATNETARGRQLNRRVAIVVVTREQ